MQPSTATAARPTLASLAVATEVWDADASIRQVEEAMRTDLALPGVLTAVEGRVFFLDRPYLDMVLTGRLGFGRALLHRHTVGSLVQEPALVLPADMTWDDAARAALARPTGRKALPVVVALDDQTLGIAAVGPLVDYLSSRYESMALHDDLTGLGNRRRLTECVAQSLAAGTPVAVMLIDLNRFKEINDTLGHTRGDELLRHVGAALGEATGPGTAFRLGGDEFVVIVDDIASVTADPAASLPDLLRQKGARLLDMIQGPFRVAGVSITVEAALGIAHTGQPGLTDLSELLAAADAAMYTAKRDRLSVELWSPQLVAQHAQDLSMQTELRHAISHGQLVLHYQPLVDARTRKIVSLEALVRWAHPERGLLPPAAFLPQAERSDVIHLLTERVLADGIAQAARWHRAGWPVPVAVNLAAPVLTSDHIVDTISRLLAETGLPGTSLIVEVTESAVMTRPKQSAARLRAIQAMGVRIAMDDFGTGYTSLALLGQLPLNELKLDRTFVMRVHRQHERVIVEAVTRMANGLGLTLVAEGVEDEHTADTLTKLGVDVLQGFHFSRPVPAHEIHPETTDVAALTLRAP